MLWRPGVPLVMPRLKEAVLRWRGAVRYGGAEVTVVGALEPSDGEPAASRAAGPMLRAAGTGQRFHLCARAGGPDPGALRPDALWRVTGWVTRSGEGKDADIWLELEHAELASAPRPQEASHQGAEVKSE